MIVDDRKVRTERSAARCEYILRTGDTGLSSGSGTVILSRVGGGSVSKQEAQEELGPFGAISETSPTTHSDAIHHGSPEGIYVKFVYWQDFDDCLKVPPLLMVSPDLANIGSAIQQYEHCLPSC